MTICKPLQSTTQECESQSCFPQLEFEEAPQPFCSKDFQSHDHYFDSQKPLVSSVLNFTGHKPPYPTINNSLEKHPSSHNDGILAFLLIGGSTLLGTGIGALIGNLPGAGIGAKWGLGVGTLLLAGCTIDYRGVGTTDCDGQAAHQPEPVVNFEIAVTPQEKEDIIRELKAFEAPLRKINPNLFCKFNGWVITDNPHDGKAAGAYNPQSKTVRLKKNLEAKEHEFGHYIDDWYGIYHGGEIASNSEEYRKISCTANNWNVTQIENCMFNTIFIEGYDQGKRASEEFAELSSRTIEDPIAALYQYSSNPNTFALTQYFNRVITLPSPIVQSNIQRILSPHRVEVSGDIESQLVVSPQLSKLLQNSPVLEYFRMNGDAFGYLIGSTDLKIYVPIQEMGNGWKSYDVKLPFSPNFYSLSLDFYQGELITHNERDASIYRKQLEPDAPWRIANTNVGSNSGRVKVAFVDGKPVLFTSTGYWLLEEMGNSTFARYPSELENTIKNLKIESHIQILHAEGKRYLWINSIPSEPIGSKGQLFELSHLGNQLSFQKVFEVPIDDYTEPFYYKGHWGLFHAVDNTYLSRTFSLLPELGEGITAYDIFRTNYALLRIEEGGNKITPYELRYSSGNARSLYIRLAQSYGNTIVSKGSKLIIFSSEDWSDAKKDTIISPAYINFELTF